MWLCKICLVLFKAEILNLGFMFVNTIILQPAENHILCICVCSLVLVDGEQLSQVFVRMMQRDKPIEMQLTAAKW